MSSKTISRKFILSIVSAAVVVTAFGARPAQALSEEDAVKLLFGAGALYMIGRALDDDDKPARVTRHQHYQGKPQPVQPKPSHTHHNRPRYEPKPQRVHNGRDHYQPRPRPLPQRARDNYRNSVPRGCMRTFETNRRGSVTMLGARCLKKHYPQAHRLPKTCRTRIHTPAHGAVKGFDPRCLRQQGFKMTRRN